MMEQRNSNQEGLKKQYGFNTPADKAIDLMISDQDQEDESNRLFKKTTRPMDLTHKLSQTVRNQNKKGVNVSHDKGLKGMGSKSRFEIRPSDFRLTAEKIMGTKMVKKDS